MRYQFLHLILLCIFSYSCKGQKAFGIDELKPEKEINLSNVKGRIDHMDVNAKAGILYMAALGNNTLEVIDLLNGKRIHSIGGLNEPQCVGYIPETDEIIVANGENGDCYFYNAKTFEKKSTIHLSGDADDVRYDATEKKIYVGYGEGGIAVIDAISHKQIADIKLPAHPEGFQLDKGLNKLFVNIPDAHIIGVVDLKESKLMARWSTGNLTANFPMSIDVDRHRLFIGYRHPTSLVVMDGQTGKELSSNEMTSDADDLYYDASAKRVYVSGGGGAIDVFQQQGNGWKQISHIPTRSGARTSLFVPSLHLFVLAERAEGNREAQVRTYKTPFHF
jgi:hypothetical protein